MPQQQRGKSPRRTKPKRGKSADKVRGVRRTKSSDSNSSWKRSSKKSSSSDSGVLQNIPKEYLSNPEKAEPILYYLPKTSGNNSSESQSSSSGTIKSNKFPSLRVLLGAAHDDIRLHRARQQAGKLSDPKLISTYKIENDQVWLTRQQRLQERELLLGKLDMEQNLIVKELLEGNTVGLTVNEATAIQLARWQRALELYIYDPPPRMEKNSNDKPVSPAVTPGQQDQNDQEKDDLDFLQLLEKLREIIGEVRSNLVARFLFRLYPSHSDSKFDSFPPL